MFSYVGQGPCIPTSSRYVGPLHSPRNDGSIALITRYRVSQDNIIPFKNTRDSNSLLSDIKCEDTLFLNGGLKM